MDLKLCESESRFMMLIWDNEPVESGRLVRLCEEQLGWKKSTTYTVLRHLCQKGFCRNDHYIITSVVPREDMRAFVSDSTVKTMFGGSLPSFLVSFFDGKKISDREAEEIKKLIDSFKED